LNILKIALVNEGFFKNTVYSVAISGIKTYLNNDEFA